MRVDKSTLRTLLVFTPLAICLVWAMSWGLRTASQPPVYSCGVQSVSVESGDTVYSIAHANCTGEIDEVISILVKMYGTRIDAWQTLHLPIASK